MSYCNWAAASALDRAYHDTEWGVPVHDDRKQFEYSNEIRSAVLMIHGEKAHSCYFSRDAYANMVKDNLWADNKELLIIPGAVHTDLYDRKDVIPFDRIEDFYRTYIK